MAFGSVMGEDAALEEVAQRLVLLGLQPPLAHTYVHLVSMGSARPGHLALLLALSRTEAYRRLAMLQAAGLAVSIDSPLTYRPVAAGAALNALRQQSIHRAALAAEAANASPLDAEDWSQYADPQVSFRRRVGQEGVWQEVLRLLDEAEREALVVLPPASSIEQQLWQCLDDALARNVAVRALAEAPDLPPGVSVRSLDGSVRMPFLVVDDREALLWMSSGDSKWATRADQVLSTGAPGFVASYRMLFERLWASAA